MHRETPDGTYCGLACLDILDITSKVTKTTKGLRVVLVPRQINDSHNRATTLQVHYFCHVLSNVNSKLHC